METQTTRATPRLLDTYGLTYAFTALLLVPGLFAIDKLGLVVFSPGYVALAAMPFLLGPAIVFALDSREGFRTVARRCAILAPLVVLTGVTFLFVAMIVILIPLSYFVIAENFGVLTYVFAAAIVVLASPMLLSLVTRIREGLSVRGLFQIAALIAAIAVVAWIVVMTFDAANNMGSSFTNKEVNDLFIGAFTWYLPAFSLAAGLWRRSGIL